MDTTTVRWRGAEGTFSVVALKQRNCNCWLAELLVGTTVFLLCGQLQREIVSGGHESVMTLSLEGVEDATNVL